MDIVVEMTSRWCEELDEVVQCPVCMERPVGKILLCIQGHHICEPCRRKIRTNECPTCKQDINGGRSFFAEGVLSKIDDIKKLVLHDNILNFKRAQEKNMVNNSTQYNIRDCKMDNFFSRVDAGKGEYPCRIGSCTKMMPHCRMINHIKTAHNTRLLSTTSQDSMTYKQSWKLEYNFPTDYDIAIHISNMELFFVNLELDQEGNLLSSVQILNSNAIGKMFRYTLEIKNPNNFVCKYEGLVKSCRLDKEKSSLLFHSDILKQVLDKNNLFECKLTIDRRVDLWLCKDNIKKNKKEQNMIKEQEAKISKKKTQKKHRNSTKKDVDKATNSKILVKG